jgi:hypothetical protein
LRWWDGKWMHLPCAECKAEVNWKNDRRALLHRFAWRRSSGASLTRREGLTQA